MELLRPELLPFALAALIPLWLHLRGRRHAPQLAFSALRFLLEQDPARARAMRLRERALIALRMVATAGIAVALAGPLLPSCGPAAGQGAMLGDEPVDLVVLLDDSLSMRAGTGGESRFSVASKRAAALVASLPRGSRAAVVRTARPADVLGSGLISDLRSVATELRGLRPRASADDGERAFALASRLLVGSERGRMVLLSDLERAGWAAVQGTAVAGAVARGARVDVVAVGGDVVDTAVVSARAEPAPDRGARAVRLFVTIGHHGPRPFVGTLLVEIGSRAIRRGVEVAAGAERTFELPVAADAPIARVALLGGDDALPENDVRHVRLAGDEAVRVGLLNGAPRPVPREDELFFLRRALEVGAPGLGALALDELREADLTAERIAHLDVLVLANVAELAPTALAALIARIEAGMGVVVTLGDGAGRAAVLGWLGGLLPETLADAQTGAADPGVRQADLLHPLPITVALARRLQPAIPALGELRAQRRLGLLPRPDLDAHVALRWSDGLPAALGFARGRGRIVLWGSSIDLDWCDLPLQPGFVPLAAGLVAAAAGQGAERATTAVAPGEPIDLPRREEARTLEIRDAAGAVARTMQAPLDSTASRRRWRAVAPDAPGVYEAIERSAAGVLEQRVLVVAPDPAENPAARLAGLDLPEPTATAGAASGSARRPRWPVAPYALAGLLLLLAGEGLLLVRGARGGRGGRGGRAQEAA